MDIGHFRVSRVFLRRAVVDFRADEGLCAVLKEGERALGCDGDGERNTRAHFLLSLDRAVAEPVYDLQHFLRMRADSTGVQDQARREPNHAQFVPVVQLDRFKRFIARVVALAEAYGVKQLSLQEKQRFCICVVAFVVQLSVFLTCTQKLICACVRGERQRRRARVGVAQRLTVSHFSVVNVRRVQNRQLHLNLLLLFGFQTQCRNAKLTQRGLQTPQLI